MSEKPKSGHWMPLYWSDYFGKTTHLTTEEHGAYLLLIGAYWQRGKPLPDDDQYLSTASRLSRKRWRFMRPKISEFFAILDGVWTHERVEKEILKSCARINSASANAYARWDAKPMLPTSTPTKERKIVDLKDFVVGKGKGEMSDENKIALFQKWLAEIIGKEGWHIVGKAADPTCPEYSEAVSFCRQVAKKNGKGWPHKWPS